MCRSLLVPLDGSSFGEHALPLALSIARRTGAKLTLAHVHDPVATIYGEGALMLSDELDQHYRDQMGAYLEDVAARVTKLASLPVAAPILEGGTVEALQEQVANLPADLVVMTTHGRGPMGRFWLGSVADKLVRQLRVPLLLVHPAEKPPDLAHEPTLKNILIPLDGSPLAERMLTPATNLGGVMGAEYTLLRVVKSVAPVHYQLQGLSIADMAQSILDQIDKLQKGLCKEAQEYLDGVAQKLRARSLSVQTHLSVDPHPAAAILRGAIKVGADLIAIETHGRGGLSRLFRGSVADKILRSSSLPMLIHHPSE